MKLDIKDYFEWNEKVHIGDEILLSGEIFCFRDAAHKRLAEMYENKKELPVNLKNSAIYYAGPTPPPRKTNKILAVGSCGPTTSSRMDKYTKLMLDLGVVMTIGKGERSEEVRQYMAEKKALYLCALGGAGAVASDCILRCDVIAFEDLGCESIKKMYIKDFPLYVATDSNRNSIFCIEKRISMA